MLILSRHDVEALLTMPDTIAAVEEGFRQLALGNVTMPQRLATAVAPYNGMHLAMPAFVAGEPGTLAIKVVTVYNDNRARFDLPTIHGVVLLHDARTGRPLALLDAEHLTAMRTGAASGVATRHLARPDSRVVTLFGSGAQAGPQLAAVCAVRRVERALVVSVDTGRVASFCAEMSARLGIPVTPTDDVRAAVEQADIICTATNSVEPVFDGRWLRPGTHINAIGAFTRTVRELDTTCIVRSRVFVDGRQAAQAEAGDLVIPMSEGAIDASHVLGELGQVVLGTVAGRTSRDEITLFKSVGMAVQDAVVAPLVYTQALAAGRGQQVALG
jgi:ornithine cyclodeaminase/alanine dehydrogenase